MMSDSHPSDDRLLDLVLRLLPESEREGQLEHLRGCAPCVDRFHAIATTHERARILAESLPSRESTGARMIRSKRRSAVLIPRRWIALAAVLFVIFVGARLLELARRDDRIAPEASWMPMPEPTVFLRGSPALDARTADGLRAYAAHDLARARHLLASSHESGVGEAVRLLYLGSIELARGENRRARDCFVAIDSSLVPEPWRGEARWSLALARRGVGEVAEADSLLRRLAVRTDEIGARARALLDALPEAP